MPTALRLRPLIAARSCGRAERAKRSPPEHTVCVWWGLGARELADHALRRKGLKTPFYAVQRDCKVQQNGEVIHSRINFAVGWVSPP
jgi:hypothetical protein